MNDVVRLLKLFNVISTSLSNVLTKIVYLEAVILNKVLDDVINDIGLFIEYWGFRKIHGKIWAIVFLSDEPISTPEIVDKLGVSKALVSGAINELLKYKLIEKVGQVKHGGVTFQSADDIAEVVRNVIKNREQVLLSKVESNLVLLNKLNNQQKAELNVCPQKVSQLKTLTSSHLKIVKKISKLKVRTLKDWVNYIKKIALIS